MASVPTATTAKASDSFMSFEDEEKFMKTERDRQAKASKPAPAPAPAASPTTVKLDAAVWACSLISLLEQCTHRPQSSSLPVPTSSPSVLLFAVDRYVVFYTVVNRSREGIQVSPCPDDIGGTIGSNRNPMQLGILPPPLQLFSNALHHLHGKIRKHCEWQQCSLKLLCC